MITILNGFKELEVKGEGSQVSSEKFYNESNLPEVALTIRYHLEDAGVIVELRRQHGEPSERILETARGCHLAAGTDEVQKNQIAAVLNRDGVPSLT